MKLTAQQQKLVENNIGLVGKVIKEKVHGLNNMRFYTYDSRYWDDPYVNVNEVKAKLILPQTRNLHN